VSEPKPKDKSFVISKLVVWDAYEKVKANQGAAGVDGESIAEFEKNLKGNLYKLWNRMSSGTYFPRRSGRWRYQRQEAKSAF
jgi:retron-type reverse transcriptase